MLRIGLGTEQEQPTCQLLAINFIKLKSFMINLERLLGPLETTELFASTLPSLKYPRKHYGQIRGER